MGVLPQIPNKSRGQNTRELQQKTDRNAAKKYANIASEVVHQQQMRQTVNNLAQTKQWDACKVRNERSIKLFEDRIRINDSVINDCRAQEAQKEQNIQLASNQIADMQVKANRLHAQCKAINEQINNIHNDTIKLDAQLLGSIEQFREVFAKVSEARANFECARIDVHSEQDVVGQFDNLYNHLKNTLSLHLQSLYEEISQLKTEHSYVNENIENLEAELAKLHSEYERAGRDKDISQGRISELEAALLNINRQKSQNHTTKTQAEHQAQVMVEFDQNLLSRRRPDNENQILEHHVMIPTRTTKVSHEIHTIQVSTSNNFGSSFGNLLIAVSNYISPMLNFITDTIQAATNSNFGFGFGNLLTAISNYISPMLSFVTDTYSSANKKDIENTQKFDQLVQQLYEQLKLSNADEKIAKLEFINLILRENFDLASTKFAAKNNHNENLPNEVITITNIASLLERLNLNTIEEVYIELINGSSWKKLIKFTDDSNIGVDKLTLDAHYTSGLPNLFEKEIAIYIINPKKDIKSLCKLVISYTNILHKMINNGEGSVITILEGNFNRFIEFACDEIGKFSIEHYQNRRLESLLYLVKFLKNILEIYPEFISLTTQAKISKLMLKEEIDLKEILQDVKLKLKGVDNTTKNLITNSLEGLIADCVLGNEPWAKFDEIINIINNKAELPKVISLCLARRGAQGDITIINKQTLVNLLKRLVPEDQKFEGLSLADLFDRFAKEANSTSSILQNAEGLKFINDFMDIFKQSSTLDASDFKKTYACLINIAQANSENEAIQSLIEEFSCILDSKYQNFICLKYINTQENLNGYEALLATLRESVMARLSVPGLTLSQQLTRKYYFYSKLISLELSEVDDLSYLLQTTSKSYSSNLEDLTTLLKIFEDFRTIEDFTYAEEVYEDISCNIVLSYIKEAKNFLSNTTAIDLLQKIEKLGNILGTLNNPNYADDSMSTKLIELLKEGHIYLIKLHSSYLLESATKHEVLVDNLIQLYSILGIYSNEEQDKLITNIVKELRISSLFAADCISILKTKSCDKDIKRLLGKILSSQIAFDKLQESEAALPTKYELKENIYRYIDDIDALVGKTLLKDAKNLILHEVFKQELSRTITYIKELQAKNPDNLILKKAWQEVEKITNLFLSSNLTRFIDDHFKHLAKLNNHLIRLNNIKEESSSLREIKRLKNNIFSAQKNILSLNASLDKPINKQDFELYVTIAKWLVCNLDDVKFSDVLNQYLYCILTDFRNNPAQFKENILIGLESEIVKIKDKLPIISNTEQFNKLYSLINVIENIITNRYFTKIDDNFKRLEESLKPKIDWQKIDLEISKYERQFFAVKDITNRENRRKFVKLLLSKLAYYGENYIFTNFNELSAADLINKVNEAAVKILSDNLFNDCVDAPQVINDLKNTLMNPKKNIDKVLQAWEKGMIELVSNLETSGYKAWMEPFVKDSAQILNHIILPDSDLQQKCLTWCESVRFSKISTDYSKEGGEVFRLMENFTKVIEVAAYRANDYFWVPLQVQNFERQIDPTSQIEKLNILKKQCFKNLESLFKAIFTINDPSLSCGKVVEGLAKEITMDCLSKDKNGEALNQTLEDQTNKIKDLGVYNFFNVLGLFKKTKDNLLLKKLYLNILELPGDKYETEDLKNMTQLLLEMLNEKSNDIVEEQYLNYLVKLIADAYRSNLLNLISKDSELGNILNQIKEFDLLAQSLSINESLVLYFTLYNSLTNLQDHSQVEDRLEEVASKIYQNSLDNFSNDYAQLVQKVLINNNEQDVSEEALLPKYILACIYPIPGFTRSFSQS